MPTILAPTAPPLNVVRDEAFQSRSITFTWDEISCLERRGEITSYAVKFGPLGGRIKDMIVQDTTQSFTKDGLTPANNYTFRVAGINSAGTGVYSDALTVYTEEDGTYVWCVLY